jgi:hypothetical protein
MKSNVFKRYINQFRSRLAIRSILDAIDGEEFGRIAEKYREDSPDPGSYSKYLDVRTWMKTYLDTYLDLNLDARKQRRVLDIGTGCGYFPFVCQYFGHEVMTLDTGDVAMYDDIIGLLDIERRESRIEAFKEIPSFGVKFDYVTAFMICFNNHKLPSLWGVGEWEFFLNDLARSHTTENGSVYLQLNMEFDGSFYDDELLEFFRSHGAEVVRERIYFSSLRAFRQ